MSIKPISCQFFLLFQFYAVFCRTFCHKNIGINGNIGAKWVNSSEIWKLSLNPPLPTPG